MKIAIMSDLHLEYDARVADAPSTRTRSTNGPDFYLKPPQPEADLLVLAGNATACPPLWPEDCFDIVWVFDRPNDVAGWRFTQVPQLLLPGDHAEPIPTA